MAIAAEFGIQPFKTQEEAGAYRENMPIAMRSAVRGPVQGLASLSGMGDIPALGERVFGGGPKFWAPESEYKGYGESRQDYIENIGGALVPGETVEGGVRGGQLLTELSGLGIAGKQAIDLIKKHGPYAVAKIKSIFIFFIIYFLTKDSIIEYISSFSVTVSENKCLYKGLLSTFVFKVKFMFRP